MRISDWSSDVCSSDLEDGAIALAAERSALEQVEAGFEHQGIDEARRLYLRCLLRSQPVDRLLHQRLDALEPLDISFGIGAAGDRRAAGERLEEHTSEHQSLMRISYAVFGLNKKKKQHIQLECQVTVTYWS